MTYRYVPAGNISRGYHAHLASIHPHGGSLVSNIPLLAARTALTTGSCCRLQHSCTL